MTTLTSRLQKEIDSFANVITELPAHTNLAILSNHSLIDGQWVSFLYLLSRDAFLLQFYLNDFKKFQICFMDSP